MINKRLLNLLGDTKKYIARNVIFQWLSLLANISLVFLIVKILEGLYKREFGKNIFALGGGLLILLVIRLACIKAADKMSFLSSKTVKATLRKLIYEKLLRLGSNYGEKASTAEVVQVAVEGVEQLESYFGGYLPQLFISLIAPVTLFVVLSFVDFGTAILLLVFVPLIPITIALVQTFAKKLLSKYWGEYTNLGDRFLENLQGITTLKIYQADEAKQAEMNKEAESFRKMTMRVLMMQLNSIVIMDVLAYGGAAVGVYLAASKFMSGAISLSGALLIILLSAEFYIPMRLLGSYFHLAMNGMAASKKIFNLLDIEEEAAAGREGFSENGDIVFNDVNFSYDNSRGILKNISLLIKRGSFVSIVGESGSGKSTIAKLLSGKQKEYTGKILIGDTDLKDIKAAELMKNITYVPHESYIFKGSVADNLLMADPNADEDKMWKVLEQVKLADFLRTENGLDTELNEGGSNFSGGQRQRLALARAILKDSPIYIFDEASSSIDVESEEAILDKIYSLAKSKTVILITHRLSAAKEAEKIIVIADGELKEYGTHEELLKRSERYNKLWNVQYELENYLGGGNEKEK